MSQVCAPPPPCPPLALPGSLAPTSQFRYPDNLLGMWHIPIPQMCQCRPRHPPSRCALTSWLGRWTQHHSAWQTHPQSPGPSHHSKPSRRHPPWHRESSPRRCSAHPSQSGTGSIPGRHSIGDGEEADLSPSSSTAPRSHMCTDICPPIIRVPHKSYPFPVFPFVHLSTYQSVSPSTIHFSKYPTPHKSIQDHSTFCALSIIYLIPKPCPNRSLTLLILSFIPPVSNPYIESHSFEKLLLGTDFSAEGHSGEESSLLEPSHECSHESWPGRVPGARP